jgi:hypothetical protein
MKADVTVCNVKDDVSKMMLRGTQSKNEIAERDIKF